jgi:hypothetical protein
MNGKITVGQTDWDGSGVLDLCFLRIDNTTRLHDSQPVFCMI